MSGAVGAIRQETMGAGENGLDQRNAQGTSENRTHQRNGLERMGENGMSLNPTDRLPPNNFEAEQAFLGCILLDPVNALQDAIKWLRNGENTFYDLRHRTIYRAMLALEGKPIDVSSIRSYLRSEDRLEAAGGAEYLSNLPDYAPAVGALDFYGEQVATLATTRELIRTTATIQQQLLDGVLAPNVAMDKLEKALFSIRSNLGPEVPALYAKEVAQQLLDYLEARSNLNGKRSGLSTGFYDLDELTDGLQGGEQFILAARPSVGKTALALNVVQRVCLMDGYPTLFVSLEMSARALAGRLLSSGCDVGMKSIRSGRFTEQELKSMTGFVVRFKSANLCIVQGLSGVHTDQLAGIIRREHAKQPFKLVVTDYLQKIRATERHEKRTYEVGETSGMLKALAVETGAAFLTVAQLNRDPDKDKPRMPRMSDLADSGQIERDADVIGLLHRDGEKGGLFIAKQRDGETGMVNLHFDGKHCRFDNPRGKEGNE